MALRDVLKSMTAGQVRRTLVSRINDWYVQKEQRPSNRADDVLHPSEISRNGICVRREVLLHRHDLRILPAPKGPRIQRKFDIGHALHAWYQNRVLGPMGVLWGTWGCSRCGLEVLDSTMPTDSCPRCQWGARSGRPTQTAAPRLDRDERVLHGGEWSLVPAACRETCGLQVVNASGTLVRDRERVEARGGCLHCGRWGEWQYREPTVSFPSLNIRGHCDGFLVDDQGFPTRVLELNTSGAGAFSRISRPESDHYAQVQLYMHGTGRQDGVILYIPKDGDAEKEYPVSLDPQYLGPILRDAREVRRLVDDPDEQLPERTVCGTRRDPRARDCGVRDLCFGDDP